MIFLLKFYMMSILLKGPKVRKFTKGPKLEEEREISEKLEEVLNFSEIHIL